MPGELPSRYRESDEYQLQEVCKGWPPSIVGNHLKRRHVFALLCMLTCSERLSGRFLKVVWPKDHCCQLFGVLLR